VIQDKILILHHILSWPSTCRMLGHRIQNINLPFKIWQCLKSMTVKWPNS